MLLLFSTYFLSSIQIHISVFFSLLLLFFCDTTTVSVSKGEIKKWAALAEERGMRIKISDRELRRDTLSKQTAHIFDIEGSPRALDTGVHTAQPREFWNKRKRSNNNKNCKKWIIITQYLIFICSTTWIIAIFFNEFFRFPWRCTGFVCYYFCFLWMRLPSENKIHLRMSESEYHMHRDRITERIRGKMESTTYSNGNKSHLYNLALLIV